MSLRAACLVSTSLLALAASTRLGGKFSATEQDASEGSGLDAAFAHAFTDSVKTAASSMSGDVRFDEAFFRNTCDLSEWSQNPFLASKYKLSEVESADNDKWTRGYACKDSGFNLGKFQLDDFEGSAYDCAKFCNNRSIDTKGSVICCERWTQEKQCKAHVGWQDLVEDAHGTNVFNPLNWFGLRQAKIARLFYTPTDDGSTNHSLAEETDQMEEADDDQEFVQQLIAEVNTMSIDGILDHLLSFYVCMRWVPDQEFITLAGFEMEAVAVDESTPRRTGNISRNDVLDEYISQHITPLRCTNNIHVQRVTEIDQLLLKFNTSSSKILEVFNFANRVDRRWGHINLWGKRQKINDALYWKEDAPNADSVFVTDMRSKARAQDVLPWSTFVRSSQRFHQESFDDDQRFLICFGPRVASNPHKREGGSHVLTDINMAGCNGYWKPSTMVDHINRLKRLFSPELCFEDKLRRELKQQFLNTFVRMNTEFEQAMFGKFTKRLHALDPTQSKKLELLTDRTVNITETLSEEERAVFTKFTQTAGLVAKAHSKWVICETLPGVSPEAFGTEDNFFRDPSAYTRWLGKIFDDTVPECRTLDPTTGCVKCAIAVKNKHDCHIRLNVTMDSLFVALRENKWPFLLSKYKVQKEVITEMGRQLVEVEESGACLVRKSGVTISNAASGPNATIQDIKNAFFQVNSTDVVVRLNLTSQTDVATDRILSTHHYEIKPRREKLATYLADGAVGAGNLEHLITALQEEKYRDQKTRWAEKFIFTDEIGELNNVREHKVDYFVSCPCSKTDFTPNVFFQDFTSQGMDQYING